MCLAGGVALNCVANARLVAEGPFDRVWVQPAAGDDGGAIGAALWAWHQVYEQPRVVTDGDSMTGAFLGPAFSHAEVAAWLDGNDIEYSVPADLTGEVAGLLAAGLLVGWFDGAMEFGPRALGHRSILADPRDPSVVLRLNRMVKGREDFRPFAPAVLAEVAGEVFELDRPSPYMLFTANVRSAVGGADGRPDELSFAERLVRTRSPIPACTHVDGSARVQTVDRSNPGFHSLLEAFRAVTGCPVLLNTSFNRAGEPVVCTPADAVRTFVATGLDVLAIQGCLVRSDAVRAAA